MLEEWNQAADGRREKWITFHSRFLKRRVSGEERSLSESLEASQSFKALLAA